MASKPILYGIYSSPSVISVIMTFKALNVDFEFRQIKPLKKENQTSEYLRKNPTGTIPALETEEHQFIGDSHAITAYVADRYARNDTLYPRDLYKRAKVQQLLHFSNSVLFMSCVKPAYSPIFSRSTSTVPEHILKNIDEAYIMMERFLGQNKWVAGDNMTIADFNCISSISALHGITPITEESHPLLKDWFERMLAVPYVNETFKSEAMEMSRRFLQKVMSNL